MNKEMKNRIEIRKKIGINRKNENGKGERKVKWNRSYKKKENEIEGSKKNNGTGANKKNNGIVVKGKENEIGANKRRME